MELKPVNEKNEILYAENNDIISNGTTTSFDIMPVGYYPTTIDRINDYMKLSEVQELRAEIMWSELLRHLVILQNHQ